jgi:hypothetical protein
MYLSGESRLDRDHIMDMHPKKDICPQSLLISGLIHSIQVDDYDKGDLSRN